MSTVVTMTDVLTATDDRPKPKRGNGAAHVPALVSGNKLAVHFGCSRQNVDQLTAQGVIERRTDGLFDQDVSRLKYLTQCARSIGVRLARRLMRSSPWQRRS